MVRKNFIIIVQNNTNINNNKKMEINTWGIEIDANKLYDCIGGEYGYDATREMVYFFDYGEGWGDVGQVKTDSDVAAVIKKDLEERIATLTSLISKISEYIK